MGILDAPGVSLRDPRLRRDNLFRGNPIVTSRGNGFGNNSGNLSNGTDTSTTYRTIHKVLVSSCEFRLIYANYYNGATLGPNTITVKASMDPVQNGTIGASSAGTAYPVSFNGARSVVIDPGCYAISDPIPLNATAGQNLYVRSYVSVASAGQKWPLSMFTNSSSLEGASAANTDATPSNSACSTSQGPAYSPIAIVGIPVSAIRPKTWGGLGDSILAAAGDNRATDYGFFVQACIDAGIGYFNGGLPGDRAASFITSVTRNAQLFACDHALEEYGTNDIYSVGATLAQLQGYKITMWQWLAARGIVVKATTLVPSTTSTDGWATTANQTIKTGETTRVAINDWIRDGAPMLNGVAVATGSNAPGTLRAGQSGHPLAGYFETADVVESVRNSGKWSVSGVRSVSDGAISASSNTFTSVTANFTAADKFRQIYIAGAGAAGAGLNTYIGAVTNATTITIGGAAASTTVSGAACSIGMFCTDGVHPSGDGHALMASTLNLS